MAISVTRKLQPDLTAEDDFPLPRSPEDWKLVLEKVKILYLRRQYKQCAARSNELLEKSRGTIHAVYKTYIHFYIAICYEELGRAAHNYSRNKLQFLNLALDNLTACSLSLPNVITVPDMEDSSPVAVQDHASSPSDISTIESIWSSSTQYDREETPIESSILSEDDPFISPDSNLMKGLRPLKFKLSPRDMEMADLMPAPLRIRKRSAQISSAGDTTYDVEPLKGLSLPETPTKGRPLPPLPLKIEPARRVFPISLKKRPDTFSSEQPSPMSPPRAEAICRYNDHIRSFSAQLNGTIADISRLIASVTEMQRLHQASKIKRSSSFWSFTPVGSPSLSPRQARGLEETKQQRIARLRSEGWTTVGLKSESCEWKGRDYYRDLCSEVLDELYELK
ncbi:hypothetical protein DTO027B5_3147 [Paecilomyces variotii]|nr:hypothetical protein DTO021C3_7116 [Paecilomyces variotii]KAJ9323127.1 hypothetical protein DTO027B3_5921 [Paecilomyces variotii]KAJ9335184.1 hypothetical protein DTO027B5_3147 [Paecilomyces variotii]